MLKAYEINDSLFRLYWKSNPKGDNISKWKIYGVSKLTVDFTGVNTGLDLTSFTYIKTVSNQHDYRTPNCVFTEVTRSALNIASTDTYYFLVRGVDQSGNELPASKDNILACPYNHLKTRDAVSQYQNVIYGSYTFLVPSLPTVMSTHYLDMGTLLGRPAKEIKISTTSDIEVVFNSANSDTVKVTSTNSFNLLRGGLEISRMYFKNVGADATLTIFIAA